ncbi:MAG: hypothetical protein IJ772_04630 [Bacilli bacterium]|nr:hypothetical protein [Bacilli bacterium]
MAEEKKEEVRKDEELDLINSLEITDDEMISKLKNWKEKYSQFFIEEESSLILIRNDETYKHKFEEFKIFARQLVISSRLQKVYIMRQEEVIASINDARKRVEEFDSKTDEERVMNYTNGDLQEINMLRVQTIPTLMIELETISPAIRANNDNLTEAGAECKVLIEALINYLESKNGR